jgi:hypothetical protein
MIDIYKWIRSNKDHGDLDYTVVTMGLEQYERHEAAIEKNANAVITEKENSARLEKEMTTFERGVGALPPGANGEAGRGRVGHSTNLSVGNPASFGYAHHSTSGQTVRTVHITLMRILTQP